MYIIFAERGTMYKYNNLLEWVTSLDNMIHEAKLKYKDADSINAFIERLYKLALSEVDPSSYNIHTLQSSINVMLMQRYFRGDACSTRTLWFPQLVKFVI